MNSLTLSIPLLYSYHFKFLGGGCLFFRLVLFVWWCLLLRHMWCCLRCLWFFQQLNPIFIVFPRNIIVENHIRESIFHRLKCNMSHTLTFLKHITCTHPLFGLRECSAILDENEIKNLPCGWILFFVRAFVSGYFPECRSAAVWRM